jgi:dGTPase
MSGRGALAGWGQPDDRTRGRRYLEREHAYRSPYSRDRDRIIHCRAFRRLEYKTQVFVNHEGDHYRTRLTHSIEVAQIARTVARALRINDELAESLALSHDLGHTPFGHLGEHVLDPLLAAHGGFDHNHQTLRVVELLERRYPDFPGLNLTWEVREGIVKHSGPPDLDRNPDAGEYEPETPPTLEAQIIDLVDEIAYNHHDIDDGLESGLLDLDELAASVSLFDAPLRVARERWPAEGPRMHIKIALRGLIDRLVSDLIATTQERLEDAGIRAPDDLRRHANWVASMSEATAAENRLLKSFLHGRLYRHPRILETKRHFAAVLRELFGAYVARPQEMPPRFQDLVERWGVHRAACDYLAGMTDRYATGEHHRLCGGPPPGHLPSATRS